MEAMELEVYTRIGQPHHIGARVVMVGEVPRYPHDLHLVQAVCIQNAARHLGSGNAAAAVHPAVPVKGRIDTRLCKHGDQHRRNDQQKIIAVHIPEHCNDFLPVKQFLPLELAISAYRGMNHHTVSILIGC